MAAEEDPAVQVLAQSLAFELQDEVIEFFLGHEIARAILER
jgi:hypothetical protein